MVETERKGGPTLQIVNCIRKPVPPGTKRRGPRPLRGSEYAIPPILAQILTAGLQRIQRNPERCAVEAEHVQSLPALLVDFDPEVLDRYWSVERIAFAQKFAADEAAEFEPLWQNLGEILQTCKDEHARGEV